MQASGLEWQEESTFQSVTRTFRPAVGVSGRRTVQDPHPGRAYLPAPGSIGWGRYVAAPPWPSRQPRRITPGRSAAHPRTGAVAAWSPTGDSRAPNDLRPAPSPGAGSADPTPSGSRPWAPVLAHRRPGRERASASWSRIASFPARPADAGSSRPVSSVATDGRTLTPRRVARHDVGRFSGRACDPAVLEVYHAVALPAPRVLPTRWCQDRRNANTASTLRWSPASGARFNLVKMLALQQRPLCGAVWPLPLVLVLAGVTLMCFPDGRLPSPRWRVVVALMVAVAVPLMIASAVWPVEYADNSLSVPHPLHVGGYDAWVPRRADGARVETDVVAQGVPPARSSFLLRL